MLSSIPPVLFFSIMGCKILPPGEKKTNAQIKREQRERKKRELGVEAFNAAEAARKRESNARVWAGLDDEEKDDRRRSARECGQWFRDRGKGAQVDVNSDAEADQLVSWSQLHHE